jgi:hypothetical protein
VKQLHMRKFLLRVSAMSYHIKMILINQMVWWYHIENQSKKIRKADKRYLEAKSRIFYFNQPYGRLDRWYRQTVGLAEKRHFDISTVQIFSPI